MNKELIIKTLTTMQENLVKEFREKLQTVHTMVDMDESDVMDPEDFSHQYESGEMEQLMRVQMNKAERNLEIMRTTDFSGKQRVEPGAYIETDQFNCLVAYATTPFECQGKMVTGISKESPIYAAMMHKKVNENFSFGGKEYRIINIL